MIFTANNIHNEYVGVSLLIEELTDKLGEAKDNLKNVEYSMIEAEKNNFDKRTLGGLKDELIKCERLVDYYTDRLDVLNDIKDKLNELSNLYLKLEYVDIIC